MVANGSVTAGSVSGVDLEDALLARGVGKQEMRGRVVLAGGLEAKGALHPVGLVSGEDFKALCDFAVPPPSTLNVPQSLDVKGLWGKTSNLANRLLTVDVRPSGVSMHFPAPR